jgi:dienelactone hydrolase
MIARAFIVLLFVFAGPAIRAQQTVQKFIVETQYLLSLPDQYEVDTARRWPLLLFLHGSGESGSDIQKVKAHGPPKLAEEGKKFPFILVSPQSDVPNGWDVDHLYRLLQQIKSKYRVDAGRIYVTGLSMGGYGTWSIATKYPDEFAAIAPVCGGGDSANAWKLRNIPVWCFHGAKDDVVLPSESQKMVKALRRENSNLRFTLYPEANHNSWDPAYDDDSLYNWLLSHTKYLYKEKKLTAAELALYRGTYLGEEGDTVRIEVKDGALVARPSNETIPLKAAGDHLFFISPDRNMDLKFISRNNRITGFIFSGNKRTRFRKL